MNTEELIQRIEALPVGIEEMILVVLILLQIVIAFLPGEPLELAAGYLFGGFKGTVLCLLGAFLGTAAIYFLMEKCGVRLITKMFSQEKVRKMQKIFKRKKTQMWIFILFLIPGTPKDLMTYVMPLTDVSFSKWLLIATFGRIPSIITSTYFAGSLRRCDLTSAVTIGIITIVTFVGGTIYYNRVINMPGESE